MKNLPSESQIQRILFNFYNALGHKLIIPNIYLHHSEADIITVQTSGYVNEIEIKRTKADFKADFFKRKHRYMTEAMGIKKKKGRCLSSKFLSMIPNYFWFAFPEELGPKIADIVVPDYYGMIRIIPAADEWNRAEIIKRAKIMHRSKISDKQVRQIARSLMFKMWKYEGLRDLD